VGIDDSNCAGTAPATSEHGQDTTERKRAENALRESEEQFRQLAEHVREVFWIKEVGLNRALYVSPMFDSVWGRSREDLYQDRVCIADTVHPEDRSRVAELLARPPETGFECEYRIIRPDGTVRWIWDRAFPIRDPAGQVYRFAGIAEDITERKLAQDRVRDTSEQLRALSARVLAAREEERTRIAREIHDELGSSLTSLKWELEALDKAVSELRDLPVQVPPIRKRIASMAQLADATVNQVRRIASELRPSILDDLGLGEALEWQAREFENRTGIACRCENRAGPLNLNADQSTAVFRIVHEALTNVLRHAQATWVSIFMEQRPWEFLLTISDNGRGIREQEKTGRSSIGLLGMKERALLVGGEIDITGVAGRGTTIIVTMKKTEI
jgi:two-component system sensor histidine kinase UhpB